jgi:hypothetical protein
VQQLHLVGLTTELDALILSPRRGAKSGSFLVKLDRPLLEAIADNVRRRDGASSADVIGAIDRATGMSGNRPSSLLSPREIQARLRAGRSVKEVAFEAGVDDEWIERFAAPIRAEQAQVVERAAQLTYVKPRRGESAEPLASSVRWNLADKGVRLPLDLLEAGWSGHQIHEAIWVVRFVYMSRGRRQVAEWELDLRDGSLAARDRLASQLAFVEKRRGRPPVADDLPEEGAAEAEPAPRRKPAARKKRAAPRKASAAKKKAAPAKKAAGARKSTTAKRTPAKKKAAPARRRAR